MGFISSDYHKNDKNYCVLCCTAPQSTLHETEGNPTGNFSHTKERDPFDDFKKNDRRRPIEISLRMSVGAKKKGMLCE